MRLATMLLLVLLTGSFAIAQNVDTTAPPPKQEPTGILPPQETPPPAPQVTAEPSKPDTISKLEYAIRKKSVVTVTTTIDAGKVVKGNKDTRMLVQAVIASDLGKETRRLKGVRITLIEEKEVIISRTVYLDEEEVQPLVAAMDVIMSQQRKWRKEDKPLTDISFRTLYGFEIGFTQKDTDQEAFARAYRDGALTAYFDYDQLGDIQKAFTEALRILKTK
jgi:hypothetical protein